MMYYLKVLSAIILSGIITIIIFCWVIGLLGLKPILN